MHCRLHSGFYFCSVLFFRFLKAHLSCLLRNLQPFYDALVASDENGKIYGDTDLNLKSTEKIVVKSRVTLDILAIVQANTDVLVHLCNLRGGQIPGKIYHYSVTKKPILFILDGVFNRASVTAFLPYIKSFFLLEF